MKKNTIVLLCSILFLVLFDFHVSAAEEVNKRFFGDVAIGGMDSVAYHSVAATSQRSDHTQLPATKGQKTYTYKWKDANWRFASKESMERFAAAPEKYAPRYNGFCANALSEGSGLVKTDGDVWEFFNNELYLFYGASGRERWLKGDFNAFIKVADAEWKKLKDG